MSVTAPYAPHHRASAALVLALACLGGSSACGADPNSNTSDASSGSDDSSGSEQSDSSDSDSSDSDSSDSSDSDTDGDLARLTVTVEGPGHLSDTSGVITCPTVCETEVMAGTTIDLVAQPDLAAWVVEWTGACVSAGDATEASVVVDGDVTCGVRFEQLPPGHLIAEVVTSKEVVREFADDADPSDSQVQLFAGTPPEVTQWGWQIIDSETGAVLHTSSERDPVFEFAAGDRGAYDVALTISDGQVTSSFRHRRLITVTLPRSPAGRKVHTVDLSQNSYFTEGMINGEVVEPGDLIVVSGSISKGWAFFNFIGTPEAPIHIINDGLVENTDASWLLHLINCRHLIVDGLGDDDYAHGIYLSNQTDDGSQAVFVRNYDQGNNVSTAPTDIEMFGIHVAASPGTGVSVRTKGSEEFNLQNFAFEDFRLHHVRIENAALEGMYIGYTRDWIGPAETHQAYKLDRARIYRNVIDNTGWDGLQICSSSNVEVHDNVVTNAATVRQTYHSSSLQWNSGNSGAVYNNYFEGGALSDLQVGCTGGDSYFYGNVFIQDDGIYIHGGLSSAPAYYLFANTVVAGNTDAVRVSGSGGANECAGLPGSVQSLAEIYVLNNLALQGPGFDMYELVAGDPGSINQVVEPNLSRELTDIADLCFADAPAGDYAIACDTSAAHTGAGVNLAESEDIPLAELPMGVLTDPTGRVIAVPNNFGAYQARVP